MAFRLQKGDYEIIKYLAEYRILPIPQLAAVFRRSKQAIRRRCRELRGEGVIKVTNNELGQNVGRPKDLFGLTERGVDVLREKDLIGRDLLYEDVGPVSNRLVDHQLLLNWFRIHLNEIDKVDPKPSLKFWARLSQA